MRIWSDGAALACLACILEELQARFGSPAAGRPPWVGILGCGCPESHAIGREFRSLGPLIVRLIHLTFTQPPRANPITTVTVTAKGQVTFRKDLLQHLGVQPGDKITVDKLPNGRIEVKATHPSGQISDVFNFLRRKNAPSLSIDEINEITALGWAGKL